MIGHDDFDRTLAGWLEAEAASPAPTPGLERVVDATRRRRPRPGWLAGPGSHWVGEAPDAGSSSGSRSLPRLDARWWTAALILLLLVAAIVGGALLVGARLVHPSPLSRLGHLAYGLDGDIYLADWDGGNPIRIADGAPATSRDSCTDFGREPTFGGEGTMWSTDGRHLAYRSCGTVLISDLTGRVVASMPGNGWLVSWAPDSARAATWVGGGAHTIGIYGLDGVLQASLALPSGLAPTGDYDPIWSPDGRSVLIRLGPPSPSVVWEVPVDGAPPQPVPVDDPRSHLAAYSPDGRRVAYTISDSTTESLIVAAADGSQVRVMISEVIPGWVESPRWSPTGDQIAFIWRSNIWQDQAGNPMPGTSELRVVDMSNGAVTSLATAAEPGSLGVIGFSPDGDRILFSRLDANNATSLWSVRTDGSEDRLLVSGTDWGDWQPLSAGP